MENNPFNNNISSTTKQIPPYVCCVLTDGVWTWFGGILLSVILIAIATIKYCKKVLRKPEYLIKHEDLLIECALADDSGAVSKIRHQPVPTYEFAHYYAKRVKHRIIDQLEFNKAINSAAKHTSKIAQKNPAKNNFHKILPFDFNRVKLETRVVKTTESGEEIRTSDYINASYIGEGMDYNLTNWIVTQGPKENTVVDFWRMIWSEKVPVIVMLTRTFEFTKVMCMQYWPAFVGHKEIYGDTTVTLLKEETFATYVVRRLKVENSSGETCRTITHYHYTEWQMFGSTNPSSLLQFRRHVRTDLTQNSLEDGLNGPAVIHCHDGGGRSGTFLAIDMNINSADKKSQVDVFGTVQELRSYRQGLVSSPDQYRFIYDVLEDYIVCGKTAISLKAFVKADRREEEKEITRQFKTMSLLQPKFTIGDCAAGHMKINRDKNRNVLIVPPDSCRPYMTSFQSNDSGDYINAVYIDGFNDRKEFILTEWPMSNTTGNFWSMVYDHDVSCIVVMNNPKISNKYPEFWPQYGYESYGSAFAVEVIETNRSQGMYNSSVLKVHKKEVAPHRKTQNINVDEGKNRSVLTASMLLSGKITEAPKKNVKLFHLLCWNEKSKIPFSTEPLTELIHYTQTNCKKSGPIIVLSNDGYSRCGTFIAGSMCVEQIKNWNEFDIFQNVKAIRRQRPQLVNNVTEYKLCYDIIHNYVSSKYSTVNNS